jgi:ribonuclease III
LGRGTGCMGLGDLERELGLENADRGLLRQALTHSSYLNENPGSSPASNERLEFLGDAVIGAIVAEYLYRAFPELPEGELTSLRAAVVRAESLAEWARELRLGEALLLGRGEEVHGARERDALLSASFEAVVAAVYLQKGYEGARGVLDRFLPASIDSVISRKAAVDAKSRLQQLYQASRQITPLYRVRDISGPDHRPTYSVEVVVGDDVVGRGTGSSKQTAEQAAAAEALRGFRG